jgi:hypothetical protein
MAKTDSSAIILGLGAAAAAGVGVAFLIRRERPSAKDTKKDDGKVDDPVDDDPTDDQVDDPVDDPVDDKVVPKKDDKDPDKSDDTTPQGDHATIGRPYLVGVRHEAHNAKIAVKTRPQSHPTGVTKAGKDDVSWYTDVAYLESSPQGPIKIDPRNTKHREYAKQWVRIRQHVRGELAKLPTGGDPQAHPTVGGPYRPGRAAEKSNAYAAVRNKPTSHPAGVQKGASTWGKWLIEFVYLESNPFGPVKLDPSKSSHRKFIQSWLRIRNYVALAIDASTTPKTKDPKVDPKDPKVDPPDPTIPKIPPKKHRTIGKPFLAQGKGAEGHNAVEAVKLAKEITVHPRGQQRGGKAAEVWLSNVVMWESYPFSPTLITSSKDPWATVWVRIRGHVRKAITVAKQGKIPKTKDPVVPKGQTLGKPYESGNLAINAITACKVRPTSHPRGMSGKASDLNWLANIVYWETWRSGPTRIPSKSSKWAPLWVKAKNAVVKCSKKVTPVTPKKVRTLGSPFKSGHGKNNAVAAVHRRPSSHPRGMNGNPSDENWLSNIVYWETWLTSPTKIASSKSSWAGKWKLARTWVRAALAQKTSTKTPKSHPQTSTTVPPVGTSVAKGDVRGAAEIRNAAAAVVLRPTSHDGMNWDQKKTKIDDWLSNVAYWSAYPNGPKKLSSKDSKHKPFISAWVRISKLVKGMLTISRKLGSSPVPDISDSHWRQLALILWATSGLRSRTTIARGVAAAWKFLRTPSGVAVVKRDLRAKSPTGPVSMSGLVGEAASRTPSGKLSALTHWRAKPSRSFLAANGVF